MQGLSIGVYMNDTVCEGYYQQYSYSVSAGHEYRVTVSPMFTSNPDLFVHSLSDVSPLNHNICWSELTTGNDVCQFTASSTGTLYAAVGGTTGDPSGTTYYTIIVEDLSKPAAPTLISPANHYATSSNQPNFSWSGSGDVDYYNIQIATDTCFDVCLSVVRESSPIFGTGYVPTPLSPDTYFWRVRAHGTNGVWSDWSAVSDVLVQLPPPSAPLLTTPANGAPLSNPRPDFMWTQSGNYDYFQIQISTDVGFSNVLEESPNWPSTLYVPSISLSGGVYYWRVRAYYASWSNWSTVSSFTILASSADLTGIMTAASTYSGGETVQIPVTVNRTGAALTSGRYVDARIYWSSNPTWDGFDAILWQANGAIGNEDFPITVLNASGFKTVNATVTIPTGASQGYLILYVDPPYTGPTGYHAESDENNNVTMQPVTVNTTSSLGLLPLYRAYNSTTKDHFYTTNAAEKNGPSGKTGYAFEKVEAYIFADAAAGTVPLYRFYYDSSMMHYYTTNPGNASPGYTEGPTIVGYVYPNPTENMVPMFHLEHETNTDHFYTISEFERDHAIKQYGYRNWGIAMYVARNGQAAPLSGRPVGQESGTDLASGNFQPYYNHVDFANPPGLGIPFVFARTYNSLNVGETGPLGNGWNHSYNVRLVDDGVIAVVKWGDGQDDYYTVNGSTYTPEPGIYNALARSSETYTLTTKEETKYVFVTNPTDSTGMSARLMKIEDKNGNALTLSYDANGNMDMISDGNSILGSSRYYQFSYLDLAQITVDPILVSDSNRYRLVSVQEQNAPLNRSIQFSYDGQGNLVKFWDAEYNLTQYEYGNNNRLSRIILPRGNDWTVTYDNRGRVDHQTIDQENKTFLYDQPDGTVVQTTVNGQTKSTSCRHTNWKVDACKDGSSYQAAEVLGYDANRNPMQVKDRNGNIWRYTYNALGSVLTATTPAPLNETTTNVYDASGRYLLQTTDPAGNVTKYEYDAKGNLKKTIAVVDGIDRATEITRYPNGLVWTVKDPRNNVTTYEYDSYGYPSKVIDAAAKETNFFYDIYGRLLSRTDADGVTTTYTYDNLNRVRTVTDHQGRVTTYTYDANGNLQALDDPRPNTNEKVFQYTNRDQLATVTEQGKVVETHGYDQAGRLASITNARNKTWTRTYDTADNLQAMITPRGYADNYTLYDGNKNLKTFTDRTNRSIAYTYDNAGRLTQTAAPAIQYVYTYYSNGLLNTVNAGAGRSGSFTYTNRGQVKTYTDPYGKLVTYAYDEAGNLASIAFDGKTVTYSYNSRNLLSTVSDWNSKVTTYQYTDAGRLNRVNYPNGTYVEYFYDAVNPARLKSVNNKLTDGTCIACFTVDAYDGLDAPTQVSTVGGIEPVSAAASASYTYDENNRIISQGFSYNDQGELLTKKGMDGTTTTFSWDGGDVPGLLRTITTGTSTWQNNYDGFGNRVSTVKSGVERRYVLDLSGELPNVIAVTDNTGTVISYYIHGLGLMSRVRPDGSSLYYHYDMNGNTVALTDGNGNVTDQYAYSADPFGYKVTKQGTTVNPFTFVGRYGVMEDSSNVYYMRARYYDAELGRFLNEDPIGFEGGDLNVYAYVGGKSTYEIDPGGRFAITLNPFNAFVSSIVETPELMYHGVQMSYFSYESIKAYVNHDYETSYANLKLAEGSSGEIRDSLKSIAFGALSANIKGSKTATKVFGKTGALKVLDMRTKEGIAVKKIWALGEKKVRKYVEKKVEAAVEKGIDYILKH